MTTFPVDAFTEEEIFDAELLGTVPVRESLLPEFLSETGLYEDIVQKKVHPAYQHYTPAYQLWSDSAAKQRWIYIPECEQIDSRDQNNWQFPVGTRFFKEFSVAGKRVETRIIERIGSGPRDFAYASYRWNESEDEATRVAAAGLQQANGTEHDIPSKTQCLQCHGSYAFGGGRPSRGLGFSALQLQNPASETQLDDLIQARKLSHPPVMTVQFPGDSSTQEALGYLHANCGNCHNDSKDGLPQNDLNLWVNVETSSPQETGAWKTAVDQPTAMFKDQHINGRIVPGNPQTSAVLYRMLQRGNIAQMPPVASKQVDQNGVSIVQSWIESLP